jgi:opacity protein-like surface antigen
LRIRGGSLVQRWSNSLRKWLIFLSLASVLVRATPAQTDPTESRAGDLQIGGGYSYAQPDYGTKNLSGFNFYGTFDFRDFLGLEANFHQVSSGDASKIYERTYEVGPRLVRHFGRYGPYAKLLLGRGVFNYPPDCLDKTTFLPTSCSSSNVDPSTTGAAANLAYNEIAAGFGVDIDITRRINARLDYEYQDWLGFTPNGLTPQVYSVGVAYHFGGGYLSVR